MCCALRIFILFLVVALWEFTGAEGTDIQPGEQKTGAPTSVDETTIDTSNPKSAQPVTTTSISDQGQSTNTREDVDPKSPAEVTVHPTISRDSESQTQSQSTGEELKKSTKSASDNQETQDIVTNIVTVEANVIHGGTGEESTRGSSSDPAPAAVKHNMKDSSEGNGQGDDNNPTKVGNGVAAKSHGVQASGHSHSESTKDQLGHLEERSGSHSSSLVSKHEVKDPLLNPKGTAMSLPRVSEPEQMSNNRVPSPASPPPTGSNVHETGVTTNSEIITGKPKPTSPDVVRIVAEHVDKHIHKGTDTESITTPQQQPPLAKGKLHVKTEDEALTSPDTPSTVNTKRPTAESTGLGNKEYETTPLHTVSNELPLHHSVDKTDGILCSSSLFALAALATLAVAAAAPAH